MQQNTDVLIERLLQVWVPLLQENINNNLSSPSSVRITWLPLFQQKGDK